MCSRISVFWSIPRADLLSTAARLVNGLIHAEMIHTAFVRTCSVAEGCCRVLASC